MPKITLRAAAVPLAVAALALTGCSVNDASVGAASTAASPSQSVKQVPTATLDTQLAQQVPQQFKGRDIVVAVSENAPYTTFGSDGSVTGLVPDLDAQISAMLGIKLTYAKTSFDQILTGIQSGRVDLSDAAGDFVERQGKVDFVDFAQSNVTVVVKNSTSFRPSSSADLCGKNVGVERGTGTENVVTAVSKKCTDGGKPALNVNAYADMNSEVLALQSGRIDALVAPTAPSQTVAAQAPNTFTVIKIDDMQSLPAATATYGIMAKKDTGLAPVLAQAVAKLQAQGIYSALFDKWNIPLSKIDASQIKVNGSKQMQGK